MKPIFIILLIAIAVCIILVNKGSSTTELTFNYDISSYDMGSSGVVIFQSIELTSYDSKSKQYENVNINSIGKSIIKVPKYGYLKLKMNATLNGVIDTDSNIVFFSNNYSGHDPDGIGSSSSLGWVKLPGWSSSSIPQTIKVSDLFTI